MFSSNDNNGFFQPNSGGNGYGGGQNGGFGSEAKNMGGDFPG
jgi:hypothetical protein